MSNRPWYYAAQNQQQGPVSESELRGLIARGVVTADTLVWTEGMAGWEKAGQIAGLMSDLAPGAPDFSSHPAPARTAEAEGPLAIDLELWPYFGWTLLFMIGGFLVIPAPWTATAFYRYQVERLRVPGRGPLSFTGQPLDIWYVFIALGVLTYVGASDKPIIQLLSMVGEGFLAWMVLRWVASNIASDGQNAKISFGGSPLGYVGWYVLMLVSAITIIGWAWVLAAWMRWLCRNIQGTRRELIFTASGLDVLWRTILTVLGCAFIIPIPWVLRWYTAWFVSQFGLIARGSMATTAS